jgi:hypothetical protein
MGCGDLSDPNNLGLIPQLVCGAGALRGRFIESATTSLEFFPAQTGTVDQNTIQIAAVCSDVTAQRVAVAYQSANQASRAEARYTNTVINCAKAGTYSFAYWWHFFFGGPL